MSSPVHKGYRTDVTSSLIQYARVLRAISLALNVSIEDAIRIAFEPRHMWRGDDHIDSERGHDHDHQV